MAFDAFNYGKELARGIVDMRDAMADDIGTFALASKEIHEGFWHETVAIYHAHRVLNPAFDIEYYTAQLREAQANYNRILSI